MTSKGFTTHDLREEQQSRALATVPSPASIQQQRFDKEQRALILRTCCGGASESEAAVLISIAEQRGLNPITGECYFVKRWDGDKQTSVWAVQASIDSFRIKADETGLYEGQDEPEYEYEPDGSLKLARVRMFRRGWSRPVVGVARFEEYAQRKKDGALTRFWKNMPHNQLAKCAEALAFRKAFPAHFARIYTAEEMGQASNQQAAHDPETGEVQDVDETQFSKRSQELKSASDVVSLKRVATAIAKDFKSGLLTLDQCRTLKVIRDGREGFITRAAADGKPTDKPDPHMHGGEPTDGPPPDDDPDKGP
jgi:phage recombination protein Bet